MKNMKRLIGVACLAMAMTAMACGDDEESKCPDGQALVGIGNTEPQCRSACDAGVCSTGFDCIQQYCIPSASTNNTSTNNTSTNNTSTNNTSTNNTSTNNTSTNNTSTNNTSTNNNTSTCTKSSIAGVCDVICQDCADGQACVAGGASPNFTVQCQPAGTAVQGGTCNNMVGCAIGYSCILPSQVATSGTCQKYCRPGGGDPSCGAGEACVALVQDMSAGICVTSEDTCTQYPNDSCGEGENCYNTQAGLRCLPYKSTAMAGDACTTPVDCNNDQVCGAAAQGAPTICSNKCDPAAPMCGTGEQCVGLTINGVPASYGVCASM